ncbi:alpha/beta-hydrolase, partial [Ramicandelaber brevisporus]
PLLVYIHGGSWRSGDKNEYESLGSAVCHLNGTRAVAIINYRLSVRGLEPQFVHPGHLLDVARALRFLYRSGPSFGYDSSRIHISGHSAGAQLVSLLVLQPIHLITAFAILDAITHVSGVGGIFDIPKLMADYPTYIDFIEMAF